MNKWPKRLLVVLQLGGGFVGIVLIGSMAVASEMTNSARFILALFSCIYIPDFPDSSGASETDLIV